MTGGWLTKGRHCPKSFVFASFLPLLSWAEFASMPPKVRRGIGEVHRASRKVMYLPYYYINKTWAVRGICRKLDGVRPCILVGISINKSQVSSKSKMELHYA